MLTWQITKSTVKRATKPATCFATFAAKRVEKRCCAFYHPHSNLSRKRDRKGAWILTSDWIKLRGSHAIHGSYVTCSKTSLQWVGKTSNMCRGLLQKVELLSTFCNKFSQPATTWFVARHVWTWVVKRATSLFNSFCSRMFQNKLHVFVACFTVPYSAFFHFYQKLNWKGYSHSTEWFEEITGK